MDTVTDSSEYFSTVDQEFNIDLEVTTPEEPLEVNTEPDIAPETRTRRSLCQSLRDPNIQLRLSLAGVPSFVTLITIGITLLHTIYPGGPQPDTSSFASVGSTNLQIDSYNSINPCFGKDSGVQNISKEWGLLDSGQIRCDKDNGGPWLVFQQRYNGEDYYVFNKEFYKYVEGFGVLSGSGINNGYWLGLSKISELTQLSDAVLRIDIWVDPRCHPCPDEHYYVEYSTFKVSNISGGTDNPGFILTVGGYSGSGGDSMKDFNGNPFIAKNMPTTSGGLNFGEGGYLGGWWYGIETPVSGGVLNAAYRNPSDLLPLWLNKRTSELMTLNTIEMKIKFRPPLYAIIN